MRIEYNDCKLINSDSSKSYLTNQRKRYHPNLPQSTVFKFHESSFIEMSHCANVVLNDFSLILGRIWLTLRVARTRTGWALPRFSLGIGAVCILVHRRNWSSPVYFNFFLPCLAPLLTGSSPAVFPGNLTLSSCRALTNLRWCCCFAWIARLGPCHFTWCIKNCDMYKEATR